MYSSCTLYIFFFWLIIMKLLDENSVVLSKSSNFLTNLTFWHYILYYVCHLEYLMEVRREYCQDILPGALQNTWWMQLVYLSTKSKDIILVPVSNHLKFSVHPLPFYWSESLSKARFIFKKRGVVSWSKIIAGTSKCDIRCIACMGRNCTRAVSYHFSLVILVER